MRIRIRIILKVGSANAMRIRNSPAEAHPGASEAHNETVKDPYGDPGGSEGQFCRLTSFGLDPDPHQSTKKSYSDPRQR
jgi:hypothetical protein